MQAVGGLTFSCTKTSSAAALRHSHPKRVITGVSSSNAIHGPNIHSHSRGRSYAALLPSDSPEPKKARKKLSKDERRPMVQAFVDKYREANGGKYPTTSAATKQVGGSYYVVKSILQELEYNNRKSPTTTSKKDEIPPEKVHKEEYLPSIEARGFPSSTTTTAASSESVGDGDDSLDSSVPKVLQEAGEEASESDKLERPALSRAATEKENEEHQLSDRSTVWGNLKSFANGIVNFWNKL